MYHAGDEEVADIDDGAYVASCEFDFIVLDLGPKEMKLILRKCSVIFASMWVFFIVSGFSGGRMVRFCRDGSGSGYCGFVPQFFRLRE